MISSNGVQIAPQALAETTPFLTTGYWYGQDGQDLTAMHATYAAIYKSQPAVAAVVNKLAASVARLSFHVWDTSNPNQKKLDLESPYARLMAKPCNFMSNYKFWDWVDKTYEIYGEVYLLKVRDDDGNVVSLSPMHPTRTAVKRDPLGNELFVFTVGVASAGILRAPAADVIPLRAYNPDNVMRGLSRLEPLRATILNADSIARATTSWWQRAGRPSVILSTDQRLSKDAATRLKESWNSSQSGPDRLGGTAILEEGLTPTIVQLSAEEMQYIESRKFNTNEVCTVFDVSPPVIHVLDEANFASITELMRSLYRDTMAPRLEDIESTIDYYLRPEFSLDPNIYGSFALDEVLRGDFETRAATAVTLTTNGIMKPSEARPLFDLPEAEPVANILYANAATVPLGTTATSLQLPASASDKVNLTPSAQEEDAAGAPLGSNDRPVAPAQPDQEKALKFDSRSMMGRLGLVIKSGDPRDLRKQLIREGVKAVSQVIDVMKAETHMQMRTKAPTILNGDLYHTQMASAVGNFTAGTVLAVGSQVARGLNAKYQSSQLSSDAASDSMVAGTRLSSFVADRVNSDLDQYDADLDGDMGSYVDSVFDVAVASLVARFVASRVSEYQSRASMDAAYQGKATMKTWNAGGGKDPRSEHSAINGETVAMNEDFSIGLPWPGSAAGGAENNAYCACYLTFGS